MVVPKQAGAISRPVRARKSKLKGTRRLEHNNRQRTRKRSIRGHAYSVEQVEILRAWLNEHKNLAFVQVGCRVCMQGV